MNKIKICTAICVILLLCALLSSTTAYALDNEYVRGVMNDQLDSVDMQSLDDTAHELTGDGGFSMADVVQQLIGGEFTFDPSSLLDKGLQLVFSQLFLSIDLLVKLLLYGILAALLDNLQRSIGGGSGVATAAFYAVLLIIAQTAVMGFTSMLGVALDTLDNLVVFIYALLPTLFALVASGGGVVSVGYFAPVLLSGAQLIILAIRNVFVPLLLVMTALGLADCITNKFGITRVVALFKSLIKWGLGLMMTLFVGIVAIQSIIAPSVDNVATKGIKYAVGNFIPLVGGMLSDSFDIIVSCSMLLKNAVGIAGMLVILVIIATPALRAATQSLILRLCAACLEPISDERIVKCITVLSDALLTIFAMLATVGIMFMINIAILVASAR